MMHIFYKTNAGIVATFENVTVQPAVGWYVTLRDNRYKVADVLIEYKYNSGNNTYTEYLIVTVE